MVDLAALTGGLDISALTGGLDLGALTGGLGDLNVGGLDIGGLLGGITGQSTPTSNCAPDDQVCKDEEDRAAA